MSGHPWPDVKSGDSRPSGARGQPLRESSAAQRRTGLAVCLAIVAATALLIPFASMKVGAIPAFLPMYQTAVIGTCLLTAYLLYAHFKAIGAVPLLHLSASYLYTAAVLSMQLATFNGLFSQGSSLIGSSQSTIWLWFFWHLAPALSVLHLALTPCGVAATRAAKKRAVRSTAWGLAIALGATATFVFWFQDSLPVLDVAGDFSRITSTGLAPALELLLAAALGVLWMSSRFRNVLHVWLAIGLIALLCDNAITMAAGSRASLGWYVGRLGALSGFSVLMIVYLWELRASYVGSVVLADQLAHSNAQLDAAAQESRAHADDLVLADHRKDEFLVMLAHELRNPLAPMRSAAHLLGIGYADGQLVRQTSQMLTRQVSQMSGLVEDLLDASRLSRGLAVLKETQLDVKLVVADAVEQVRPLLEQKSQLLHVQLPLEDVLVSGEHRRMVQIVTNVLMNAAKYSPIGAEVDLRLVLRRDELVMTVTDNGIGMSPELVSRAFQLFTQGDPSPDRPQGGLGIGLSLVRSLVELHRGTVRASSGGPGLGSEVVIVLPTIASHVIGGRRPLPTTPCGVT